MPPRTLPSNITSISTNENPEISLWHRRMAHSDYNESGNESNSEDNISEYRVSGSTAPDFHIYIPLLPADYSTYRPIKANGGTILDLSDITDPEPTTYGDAISGPESKKEQPTHRHQISLPQRPNQESHYQRAHSTRSSQR
jgi:hypothetical protein